jgi:hypothetical protein
MRPTEAEKSAQQRIERAQKAFDSNPEYRKQGLNGDSTQQRGPTPDERKGGAPSGQKFGPLPPGDTKAGTKR